MVGKNEDYVMRREARLSDQIAERVSELQHDRVLPRSEEVYLYFVLCGDKVKIGIAKNIYSRLAALQTGNPELLKLYGYAPVLDEQEAVIHAELSDHHYRGEWFWWNDEVKKTAHALPHFYSPGQ